MGVCLTRRSEPSASWQGILVCFSDTRFRNCHCNSRLQRNKTQFWQVLGELAQIEAVVVIFSATTDVFIDTRPSLTRRFAMVVRCHLQGRASKANFKREQGDGIPSPALYHWYYAKNCPSLCEVEIKGSESTLSILGKAR